MSHKTRCMGYPIHISTICGGSSRCFNIGVKLNLADLAKSFVGCTVSSRTTLGKGTLFIYLIILCSNAGFCKGCFYR